MGGSFGGNGVWFGVGGEEKASGFSLSGVMRVCAGWCWSVELVRLVLSIHRGGAAQGGAGLPSFLFVVCSCSEV